MQPRLVKRLLVGAAGLVLLATTAAAVDRLAAAGGLFTIARHVHLAVADGYAVQIGRIAANARFALATPALAAETVRLDDVVVEAGAAIYRMPRIELSGSSLDRAQLMTLFNRKAPEPLAQRLSALSASAVTIPELAVEQAVPGGRQTVIYRDIALTDIAAGRIGAMVSAGGTIAQTGGAPDAVEGTFGPIAVKDFDLVLMTRLYTGTAGAGDREPRRVYADFSMEKIAFRSQSGASVSIERIAGRDFRARPTRMPWLDAMKLMSETPEPQKLPAEERARFADALTDLAQAFDLGTVEIVNLTVDDPGKNGKSRIARIAFTGGATPEARVEGMDIKASGADVRLGLMSFSGFSFAPTLDGLREFLMRPDVGKADIDFRRFVPDIGTMKIADIEANLPQEGGESLKMAIRGFEATAGKPLNGIPTAVRVGLSGISLTIPPKSKEAGFTYLREMGYGTIDLSFATDAVWNEPGNEFVVNELSASGVDMGLIAIRGTVGNVTKDLFAADAALAQVALVGATVKTMHVSVENKGLVERALTREAGKQGRKPAELRAELGMAAAVGIPALLGNSKGAKDLANAIARFLAKPGRLDIGVRTKDPAGLGLADFVAAGGEPTALLDRLDITATAE